jgi:nicotinamide riboside kinase
VAFVGIPSHEQSKLVKNIAKKFNTAYVDDNLLQISREKLLKNKIDFHKIACEKYRVANTDDKIYSGKEYLFYNSTGFIDNLLSIATHNKFNRESYNFFSEDLRNYDLVLVNNIPKDNIGKTLDIDSTIFLNQLTKNLDTLGIAYQMLQGTFEEKLLMAEKSIKAFTKRFNSK